MAAAIQAEIAPLINDNDLQQASIALKVASNLVESVPQANVHQKAVNVAAEVAGSQLIQGACLK